MNWFYVQADRQQGPVTDAELGQMTAMGTITASTLVWHEGMTDWRPYAEVAAAEGLAGAQPDSAYACVECGRSFPPEEMVAFRGAWICAECKPLYFQRLQESGEIPNQLNYAGFWIRFGAKFLDGIILGVVGIVTGAATGAIFGALNDEVSVIQVLNWLMGTVTNLAYCTWFLGRFGATPGKMAAGLKVIRPDGSPISYQRALGRTCAEWISSIILLIGYIIAAFDDEKRTLHDRIADTRVVYK